MMNGISFKNPEFFYLFLLMIPMIAWYIWRNKKTSASIQFSSGDGFCQNPKSWRRLFDLQARYFLSFQILSLSF